MTLQIAQLVAVLGSAAISTASAVIGAIVVLPPSKNQNHPWWERARLTFPSRLAPVITVYIAAEIAILAMALSFAVVQIQVSLNQFLADSLPIFLGPIAVAMFMAWLASPRPRPIGHWLAGCVSSLLIRFPKTLLYAALVLALLISQRDILTIMILLLLGMAGMVFISLNSAIWVAGLIGLARPGLPRASLAADWAAERVGAPYNKI